MKITKYEHACMTIEQAGKVLVVDPGNFTTALTTSDNIVAIVITHEHADHFDPDILASIYAKNPDSILVSLAEVVEKMPDHKSQIIKPGDKITIAPFELEFFGGKHAQIHSSIPIIDNVGVMVNDSLYYPGDSFAEPHRPVTMLALPASGPWFKTSDAIDFLLAVKPAYAFPTHNVHNSEPGQALFDKIVSGFTKQTDIDYVPLDVGQTVEA